MNNAKQILSESELMEYWENFTGLKSEDAADVCETYIEEDPSFVSENDLIDEARLKTIDQEVNDEDNYKVTQKNIRWKTVQLK